MQSTILQIINEGLNSSTNNNCFFKKYQGEWKGYSKNYYKNTSDCIAYGLIKEGINSDDKVIIASENNPEWNLVDYALLKLGVISVPAYATISDAQLEIILFETEAKFAFVSNKYLYRKLKSIAKKLSIKIKIYSFDKIEEVDNLNELISVGEQNKAPRILEELQSKINENDIYSILYTSGTTGHPKGVMLSHKSHLRVINDVRYRINIEDNYRTILYLPLNNSFGRTISYIAQINGMSIYYVNGINKLQQAIQEVKPNFMATAPLLLEKIMIAAIQTGDNLPPELKPKFENARKVIANYKYSEKYFNTPEYKEAYKLFYSRWTQFLGGEMKTLLAGGALVGEDIHSFFSALKIIVLSGYGLTETSGVITVDSFDKETKPGKCGVALTNLEIKISEEGEILARGENMMLGYYKHPEITAETIDKEGWIHTGDLGELDEEGYLGIKGRLKSSFKLKGGEYVYSETIEEKLKKSDLINQVVVTGLGENYIIALIIPNFEYLQDFLKKTASIVGLTREEIVKNDIVIEHFNDFFNNYNSILVGANQRVEKFKLLTDNWSIESGEITPTMKIRRNYIIEKYNTFIKELFNK